jgi:hypothetical protein
VLITQAKSWRNFDRPEIFPPNRLSALKHLFFWLTMRALIANMQDNFDHADAYEK